MGRETGLRFRVRIVRATMSITLDQITKRYQGSPVVNDVSMEVGDGEFLVLLGPSGSGKSTLLRAIAGLTGVDHGRIALHGRDVTQISARERGVGLVFQNYALFRHMTVADNIEFALQIRGMKAGERRKRRTELLRLVALEGMDQRLPAQLSGGQQQRVAVARALAHKPEVLLLDEPFGALDAKIRDELRRTIRAVQRELGITTILVTHDQEEAFALADRIGVMNLGRLLELGKPADLYARPATRFVATFLGAANLLLARQTSTGIQLGAATVAESPLAENPASQDTDKEVVAVLRPEEIELAAGPGQLRSTPLANGVVEEIVFTGGLERLRVRLANGTQIESGTSHDGENPLLEVTRTQPEQRGLPAVLNQHVAIGVRRIHVLPTPLSSFVACAGTQEQARELSRHPFLTELAARMKTRVGINAAALAGATPGQGATTEQMAGVTVIATGTDTVSQIQTLLRKGASQVLVLPPTAAPIHRVLIHWLDEAARRATLAVAASLLRHVSAEAVYFAIVPEGTRGRRKSSGVRAMLNARSEAQSMHGLEMRTELAFGDAARELARELSESPGQMLILGVADIDRLGDQFGSLLQSRPGWPLLIVHRSEEKFA